MSISRYVDMPICQCMSICRYVDLNFRSMDYGGYDMSIYRYIDMPMLRYIGGLWRICRYVDMSIYTSICGYVALSM